MTADTAYATSRGYEVRNNGRHRSPSSSSMESIIGIASAGFRLSLLLNAVGTGMENPDCDIHHIAKTISLFSLMLKQTGVAMRDGGRIATQAAVDVATEISHQGQLVFDEIKNMTDLSQGRDEKGILRSITIAEKDKWAFKKYKVQYLLGQLEALKLSLAVMLQVLRMGQGVASTHHDPSAQPLAGKAMMQERAEIQNMIVVQHWSLVDLRRLYDLAENEAREDAMSPHPEEPPPSYDSHRAIEPSYYAQKAAQGDLQLSIVTPPVSTEDASRAMIKYQERPIQHLDAAFTRALVKENQALGANVNNIVDHLLVEWTHISELDSKPISMDRRPSLSTYYESDEEDTTESEYEGSLEKGRYIEAPRRKVKKDVRFQPRVESDSEGEAQQHSHRRAPRRHILHSETDTSSDSDTSPISPRSQPGSRRSSEVDGNRYIPNAQDPHDRNPRPYATTGRTYRQENPGPNPPPRPASSRGIPLPPMGPVPTRSMPNVNQWQGTPPIPQSGLRPPSYQGPSGGPPRPPSAGGLYAPPGYMSYSPQPPSGNYFPQQQQRPQAPPTQSRPHRNRRHRTGTQKAEEDKHNASKNLKRGLFGGAALAGMLDLLQGLDGI